MAQRAASPLPSRGTVTATQHQQPITSQPTLRLRGASTSTSEYIPQQEFECEDRRIHWADDVIDNEGMGKKKSKVCCIYHKPRPVGESSDESSSSDDSDSDSGADDGSARPVGGKGRGNRGYGHDHDHAEGDECGSGSAAPNAKGKGKQRRRSPNAYEKMPKVVKKVEKT